MHEGGIIVLSHFYSTHNRDFLWVLCFTLTSQFSIRKMHSSIAGRTLNCRCSYLKETAVCECVSSHTLLKLFHVTDICMLFSFQENVLGATRQ